jgi:coenzyme F420-dependent glucose-6-phosphate dehydrogenase
MALIGYHASHEQFSPSDLLEYARLAEQAGFQAAMCSDHFHPWSERQAESGFAWSWLGAALATTDLSFGVVNAPGQRYHPAIIAQASATLGAMFPGRFWLALGSGQALNELITGETWPTKEERNARLKECVDVIRALHAGETVTHRGRVIVEEARLYTRPEKPPLIVGAAITPETARWVGGWADALITVSKEIGEMEQVVEAFREGGGDGKPMFLQVQLSWAADEDQARDAAFDQWRMNIFDSPVLTTLRTPAAFDAAAAFVHPGDLDGHIRISAETDRHIEWLSQDIELGFERLYLHNVGRNQAAFIRAFGEKVLPALRTGERDRDGQAAGTGSG